MNRPLAAGIGVALLATAASSASADIIVIANSAGSLVRWDTTNLAAPIGFVIIRDSANPNFDGPRLGVTTFRPSDGLIYANGEPDRAALWKLDASTGLATRIGTMPIESGSVAMDIDPVSDELRVIVNQGAAQCLLYRVDPDTAAVLAPPIQLESLSTPTISSTAFRRSGSARFLGINTNPSQLGIVEIGVPTPSQLNFLWPTPTEFGGFDTSFTQPNIAYIAWTQVPFPPNNPHTGELGTINLTTGQYTRLTTYQAPGFFTTGLVVLGPMTPPPACPGDTNADNTVNSADLSVLLGQFGTAVTPGSGADLNADGLVNAADLSVLLANFGNAC